MTKPSLRRDTKLLERSWPWTVVFVVLTAGLFAAAYIGIRGVGSADSTFTLIAGLGAVALLLIIASFLYSLRKRALQEKLGGTMMSWLGAHVWLGVAALSVAVIHASLFPSQSGFTTGRLTLAVLVLLIVSGVAWRVVYKLVPPRVAGSVSNLAVRDTQRRVEELSGELEKMQAGKSADFRSAVDALVAKQQPSSLEGLEPSEREAFNQVKDLVARIDRHSVRQRRQVRYSRFLQGWRILHLPLAAILLGLVVIHVADVFEVDRTFGGEKDQRFASSAQCADCHASIVDEWKLSAHRNAQGSTITQAQTLLAIAQSPEIEKLCVNCHAPVATKFTQKATFSALGTPLDPTGVQEEGITCIVCHTQPKPPGELAGAAEMTIGETNGRQLPRMFGPPLDDPLANSAHDSATGFMTAPVSSSQLCASCHNVKADIDGDGLTKAQFSAADPNGEPTDIDGNGRLDENELDIEDGRLQDLVLQTTFDEWEQFLFDNNGSGPTCVDCHMPSLNGPIVGNPPAMTGGEDRSRRSHVFAGVDYELDVGYYTRPGMPKDALARVLEERERLLSEGVTVKVEQQADGKGRLAASVEIANAGGAHDFPSGFAFARQVWLEVSASTESGKQVCLVADPNGVKSPCASGVITQAAEDLATCDPAAVGKGNKDILFTVTKPTSGCDPWLTNYQKILTDGDPDGDGIFTEVPYQSLRADIVKLRVRTADQKVMAPLPPGESAKFAYVFDLSKAGGEKVEVKAVLRFRHLPPYFVRGLEEHYPSGVTSEDLLKNMTVVDMASNLPTGRPLTTPTAAQLIGNTEATSALGLDVSPRSGVAASSAAPVAAGSILVIGLAIGAWSRRSAAGKGKPR